MSLFKNKAADPVTAQHTQPGNNSPIIINVNCDNSKLDEIIKNQIQIMQELEDLKAAVAAEDTVIDSAVTLLNGIAAQIAALTPDKDAIAALAADVKAKTQTLADAVVSGTGTDTGDGSGG